MDLKNEKFKPQFILTITNGKMIGVISAYTYFCSKQYINIFHLHDCVISKEHKTPQLELELLNFVTNEIKKQGFTDINITKDGLLENIIKKLTKKHQNKSALVGGKSTTPKASRNNTIKTIHLK